jgi:Amt family ammonium transporter
MQLGFCMLEAGAVRKKSITPIIVKNILDSMIAALAFYIIGYNIAYMESDNSFIGGDGVYGIFMHKVKDYSNWMFQWAFVSTMVSIVSGAVAERMKTHAYLLFALLSSAFVYPVTVYWVWSTGGWLSPFSSNATHLGTGVIDFAGCGTVHLAGGTSALLGAYMVGPRSDRFRISKENPGKKIAVALTQNSQGSQAMGVFILWFAWYYFNSFTILTFTDLSDDTKAQAMGRIAICTTLSSSACALTSAGLAYYYKGTPFDLVSILNGVLAGLVSITSACATISPWASIIIGIIGGIVYCEVSRLVLYLEVDDVVDAVAVHGGCGIWGLLAAALFSDPDYVVQIYHIHGSRGGGLFFGGGQLLGLACMEIISIICWYVLFVGSFFYIMNYMDALRLPIVEINDTLDKRYHGIYDRAHRNEKFDELYNGRQLPPATLNAIKKRNEGLDKVTLLVIALEAEVGDIKLLLKMFDDVAGGSSVIKGEALIEFCDGIRRSYRPDTNGFGMFGDNVNITDGLSANPGHMEMPPIMNRAALEVRNNLDDSLMSNSNNSGFTQPTFDPAGGEELYKDDESLSDSLDARVPRTWNRHLLEKEERNRNGMGGGIGNSPLMRGTASHQEVEAGLEASRDSPV